MSLPVIAIENLSHYYGKQLALDNISVQLPKGISIGLIGPDGVGKSTLLSVIAGMKLIQQGKVRVLGKDMGHKKERPLLLPRIAFMPQGLGHNLYPTLSIYENIDFHARLFGLSPANRQARTQRLMQATRLAPFADRAAGKLSGGMKQKLSLCCALVHHPDLLILDEPTTGVDPLSRRQFWELVDTLKSENEGMTVIVATAYIDEAERFDYLMAMDAGKLLFSQPTTLVLQESGCSRLEQAYIQLLPPDKQTSEEGLQKTAFKADPHEPYAMQAEGLTQRFGDFTAVNQVSFNIHRGEIFGFLGSNGCGKSTTMKMLTGLLAPTEGTAKLLGKPLDARDINTKKRVGYMSQVFSLYEELSVLENLRLHARLYQIEPSKARAYIKQALIDYDLQHVAYSKPASLPLGVRQRLQLAAACLHHPDVLILDEPTSGVDPAAREMFWRHLIKLSRQEKITIFVATHFMNEAMRCDRVSFMHQGQVLAVDTPEALIQSKQKENLEQTFTAYLEEVSDAQESMPTTSEPPPSSVCEVNTLRYALSMIKTFAIREGKEVWRDKIRLFFAMFGPLFLMVGASLGISFDIKDIRFAVLDRDQTTESRLLVEHFTGSPYFSEMPSLSSSQDIDLTLKRSVARLVIDIPPDYGKRLMRGERPAINFIIDGSVPFMSSNIQGDIQGVLGDYISDKRKTYPTEINTPFSIVPRFVYNQDFNSINSVAPGMIMMALMIFPAMMMALGVVREKEIGSISNLYTSPASVRQFLLGKQIPYIGLSFVSFLIMVWIATVLLDVPLKGSFLSMSLGAFLLILSSTAFGLLISCFVKTQVAAIFATAILSLIPSLNYSGMLFPVSTLEGSDMMIAWGFPAAWYQLISIGTFTKGLGGGVFLEAYAALFLFFVLYLLMASLFLKKQER